MNRTEVSQRITKKQAKEYLQLYLNQFLKNNLHVNEAKEDILRLLGYLDPDKQGTIDFDDFMSIVLEEHALFIHDPILEFFETADLNGDGSFDFEEFVRITRHVESEFYLEHKDSGLYTIFGYFATSEEGTDEKVINPIGFKKLCREYRIYSLESQNVFLSRMELRGLAKTVEELVETWRLIIEPRLEMLLLGCSSEEITIFCSRLSSSILNYNKKNQHKIWLNYKILEAEIERLNTEVYLKQNIIPWELQLIDKQYKKIISEF